MTINVEAQTEYASTNTENIYTRKVIGASVCVTREKNKPIA